MKYKVNYTASAKRDIRGIYEYVAYQLIEPDTAADLVRRIQSAVQSLTKIPKDTRFMAKNRGDPKNYGISR